MEINVAATNFDIHMMRMALSLAARGLGQTAPNPAVGCVIAKDGVVVGRGWTQPGGRPHAEVVALTQAGETANGATAYVTLEPCAHFGETPPCANALVEAGIQRVFIATGDPDSRVAGKGIEILEQAGVDVEVGLLKPDADQANCGFFNRLTKNRPWVTLKLATTIDGKIALENGESQWITGPESRRFGHLLRATNDAILVGIGTVLADDPSLDCRLGGLEARSPVRVVVDSDLRIPLDCKLIASARNRQTIVFHTSGAPSQEERLIEEFGVDVVKLPHKHNPAAVCAKLADKGITRLLVEGGGRVHASFLHHGIVDQIEHFSAGKLIGSEGVPVVGGMGLASLADAPHLKLHQIRQIGPDMLASYVKAE